MRMNTSDKVPLRDQVVREAFQYREALKIYAFGMLRDWTVAEDVVQDTFIIVMKKYKTFQAGSSMLAWTRSILRLKVLQHLDREKRRQSTLDNVLFEAVDAALSNIDEKTYREEFRKCYLPLKDCLSRISSRSHKLLTNVYAGKMSYEKTAESLGMTVEAVRKNLYRTKQQVRLCLQNATK